MSNKPKIIVSYNTPEISVRFIETLLEESSAILTRYGESRKHAEQLSRKFVLETGQMLGGKLLYVGKNNLFNAQQRRFLIRREFNEEATQKELSEKFQLSTRHIHAIIHEIRDDHTAKAATKGADFIAITAAKIFIRIGESATDATNAARGLLAVISAKYGGKQLYIPTGATLERTLRMIEVYHLDMAGYSHAAIAARYGLTEDQIAEISDAYPATVRAIPDTSELPKIRTRLCNMAVCFSGYAEINTLLGEATERISRVEQIINKLEGK